MSDLYLDTEVRPSCAGIALVCLESGFDREMLEHILIHEVAPACGPNLLSVAGEWALFPDAWLAEHIKPAPYPPTLAQRLSAKLSIVPWEDWHLVLALIPHLRTAPNPALRSRGLRWCINAYVTEQEWLVTPGVDLEDPKVLYTAFNTILTELGHAAFLRGNETFTEAEARKRLDARLAQT